MAVQRDEILHYHALGYDMLPIVNKRPIAKWRDPIPINDLFEIVIQHQADVGFVTGRSGIVIVDADSQEAVDYVRKNLPETPQRARTRRGEHFYYAAPAVPPPIVHRFHELPLDILSRMSFAARKEWITPVVSPNKLPVFPSDIIPAKPLAMPPLLPAMACANMDSALAYVRSPKTPGAVSGQSGHTRTLWVCTRLLALFHLDFDQLLHCMHEFNKKCSPPWKESELIHKCKEAFKFLGRIP